MGRLWAASWSALDQGPDTATARAGGSSPIRAAGAITLATCSPEGTCAAPLPIPRQSVHTVGEVPFADVDGEVRVTGLRVES